VTAASGMSAVPHPDQAAVAGAVTAQTAAEKEIRQTSPERNPNPVL